MASKYDPIKTAELIKKYQDQYNQAATRKVGASSDSNSRRMYYAANKLRELGGKVPDIDRPMYGLQYKPTAFEKLVYKNATPAAGQYYRQKLSDDEVNRAKSQFSDTKENLRATLDKSRQAAKDLEGREAQMAARNKAFEDYNTALKTAMQQRRTTLRGMVPANVAPATPSTPAQPASLAIPKYTYERDTGFTEQPAMKKGGKVKSHRGDGIAQRGKTRGRMV